MQPILHYLRKQIVSMRLHRKSANPLCYGQDSLGTGMRRRVLTRDQPQIQEINTKPDSTLMSDASFRMVFTSVAVIVSNMRSGRCRLYRNSDSLLERPERTKVTQPVVSQSKDG